MSLRYLPNTASIDEIVEVIREDGGVIIRGFLKPRILRGLRQDLLPRLEGTPGGEDAYFAGAQTGRLSRLFARSKYMVDLALNPLFLQSARALLQTPINGWSGEVRHEIAPDIQVGVTQAIQIRPGQGKQPLHRDDSVWLWRHPHYGREARLQIMVALSAFSRENGATHVIPGSHRWDDERMPTEAESVQAEMEPGDALLWVGSTYHGGGENRTSTPRTGLTMAYDLAILRQEENHFLSLPLERVRQFPEELQRLLGWSCSATFMGWVELNGQFVDPHTLLQRADFREPGQLG
ncbi:phytanoyl-CoA dioxygenase family protein [Halopseudomonas maritima]|uniref:phytanoyl-CoA dioxygenase family protein n=1 Tax=Halopseudomonas maritima TaxID=2918528 RepID=UPI001EEBE50F|nr:phytanoyl-CoA dioxygenase family protein [Halopseudomonas maritima]UJJ31485.1 phytanoyl-CoA dioxygenase family protein [Halopseudomonas maritima]